MIEINKEVIYQELRKRIDTIFSLPETCAVTIKGIVIEKSHNKESVAKSVKQAVEMSYHDILSDIDISVKVNIPHTDNRALEQYMKMIERYGITRDCYLSLAFVPENRMYRIILQNGMRYDLGFEFIYDNSTNQIVTASNKNFINNNEKWPLENIDKFWFVQIQALAKLYRNDFLISDHLANININETLVQQMVLRDIKYETTFHRYGYQEELAYLQIGEDACPYKRKNTVFNRIAAKIYAAAITYDKLTLQFYPEYKKRSHILFDIWDCYDKSFIL